MFSTPPGLNVPQNPGTVTSCSPSPFPVTLVSGLVCGYLIGLPNASPGDAHAIADVDSPPGGRHVETPFDFANPTVNEVDECVNVTDSMAGALGTVCAGDSPKTFTYTKTVGRLRAQCGDYTVDNTASFVTNDTGATGSASASVDVTVVCSRRRAARGRSATGRPMPASARRPTSSRRCCRSGSARWAAPRAST